MKAQSINNRRLEPIGKATAPDFEPKDCSERDREIPARLNDLHNMVEYLSEQVALLRGRLSPVLTPTPDLNKNEVQTSRTGLGNNLAELLSKVALISSGMNDILGALEL